MLDLKVIHSVLDQLEEERGIPREKVVEAIEDAMATAYKKEYGKRGQIVRAHFDLDTGETRFEQIKIVKDPKDLIMPEDDEEEFEETQKTTKESLDSDEKGDDEEETRVRFNPEQHILIEDAQKMKKDVKADEELVFPLEEKDDYGRISAQTAKQVIIQKIREAEKISVHKEFGQKQGDIITGTVQRVERGNIFVDVGRANAILPYEEQIPGERFKQGEHVRGYLYSVEETPRGVFLRISRSKPEFLYKLFETEAPEVANGVVEIKAIAREAGSRSKIAVVSNDEYVDPVGSLVGQRGVRVSTVMSELGGEKIDIIEWSEDPTTFVEEALSPARINSVEIDEDENRATVTVESDQQSLAIGKGGQNARLAAKLTGWKIDIKSEGLPEEDESPQPEADQPLAENDEITKDEKEEAVEETETPASEDDKSQESK
ncbi:transcription termination/antitermination protein NusA [Candidatus Campbellbacteria bacterium CG22_combo_CG10-13_8_21_14_all_36_13]|uniref:Transcription termination/antitermination protein NusA n=1 Tax=Candidatus Campbellbacteria bacterium CG22_combo_CG10-13_8_21_14_all_36_13 TaxID=1974529 RepID=A0A2H0DYZ1_9BACT|nr:MAG: transcription termination/antitermination protein NusA [Candidatus Campbellbacteria bacterium CG22_combo_CG10-13_8_21_14_all_36_13]